MIRIKKLQFILLAVAVLGGCSHEESTEVINDQSEKPVESTKESDSTYNEALALELGADDYGMRKYVMAYLKVGPNRTNDKEDAAKLQRAHMDNITRMAEEGVLVVAGPFMDDGDIRGIYIFAVETLEEAEKLTSSDPAIQAGSLVMELHQWYGSAALMKVNDIHNEIAKINI